MAVGYCSLVPMTERRRAGRIHLKPMRQVTACNLATTTMTCQDSVKGNNAVIPQLFGNLLSQCRNTTYFVLSLVRPTPSGWSMRYWTSDEVGELPYTGSRCQSNLGIYGHNSLDHGISHLIKLEQLCSVESMISRILEH